MTPEALFAAAPTPDLHAPARPLRLPRPGPAWAAGFLGCASATVGFTLWLLSRQYLSEAALWSWSETMGRLQSEQGGVLRVLGLYPQLQNVLVAALSSLPGLRTPMVPYLL